MYGTVFRHIVSISNTCFVIKTSKIFRREENIDKNMRLQANQSINNDKTNLKTESQI